MREKNMKKNTAKKLGFTLVEIMIVVAIIGLLAAIAIPNFVKARTTSQQNACINNLRLIDAAKQQWALEQRQQTTASPNASGSDLQPYLGRGANGELPTCPVDPGNSWTTSYTINIVSTPPQCAILPATHVLP
jgi:prepilin-type N-terminal cleavage/methylation domain-containing protein